ncbi:MAG: porin, partial [Usitatibacter sp.]
AFRPDSNTTTFAGRNSGIGLQGGFGSILMGRWDSPFKSASIAVDPFGDLTISGITGTLSDGGNFDRRLANVVQYWSPTIAGFAVRLARTANEGKTASLNPYEQAASLTYTGGPAYAFLTYEEHKDQLGSTPTSGLEDKGTAGGGSFVIGPVKLGGQYQEIKKTNRTKQKNVMGNVTFTFGNNQLIYQFMNSKDGALSVPGTAQPDCDSNSVGYQYNFTRRTFFLAQYTKVDNNDAASCNFGANRLAIAAGQDPQGVSLGIRHVF